jgi:uncharacterized GH25 family protein
MRWVALIALLGVGVAARAHDIWIQTNAPVIRVGDVVHLDLMLGNEHRDYKLASKLGRADAGLFVIDPDGERFDMASRMVDAGYTPQEGYWTTRFEPTKPGLYLATQRSDRVMSYAPERSIKSAKAYFVVSESLDRVSKETSGYDRAAGHELELVPITHPVTSVGPGTKIGVRLIYKGRPLAGERVAFIPRGATLESPTDPRFERVTDAEGAAFFEPTEANYYLIVAHKTEATEAGVLDGKAYDFTKYSATLSVIVPRICVCCGG